MDDNNSPKEKKKKMERQKDANQDKKTAQTNTQKEEVGRTSEVESRSNDLNKTLKDENNQTEINKKVEDKETHIDKINQEIRKQNNINPLKENQINDEESEDSNINHPNENKNQANDNQNDQNIQMNEEECENTDINHPIENKDNSNNINRSMNDQANNDGDNNNNQMDEDNLQENNENRDKHNLDIESEVNELLNQQGKESGNNIIQKKEEDEKEKQKLQNQQNQKQILKQSQEEQEDISTKELDKLRQMINKIKQMTMMNDNNAYLKYFNEEIAQIFKSIFDFSLNNTNLESLKLAFYFITSYIIIRTPYIISDQVSSFEINWLFAALDNNIFLYRHFPYNLEEKVVEQLTKLVLIENNPDENAQALIKSKSLLTSQYKKISQGNNLFYKYLHEFLLKINFFEMLIQRLLMPFCDTDGFLYLYCMISKALLNYDKDPNKIVSLYYPLIKSINERFNELTNEPSKELNKFQMDYLYKWNLFSDFSLLDILYEEGIENNNDHDIIQLLQKDLLVAYKMSCSNNLEKRVIGIKYLNDLCSTLIVFEVNKQSYYMHFDQMLNFKKIIVIEFFSKIHIFDKIYGENIHQAVITKSSMILVYLYKNNRINYNQINYLWKLSQEKHQSISESILFVFSDLIPYFSIDISMHLLKIINELNMKEVNEVTVKILESFSNNTNCTNDTISAKDFKDLYLKILMKFSNETSHYNGLTAHIILKSRRVLCDVLLKYNFRHDLYKYIKKCIYGIGCNQIISTHLAILDMLLKNIQCSTIDLKPVLSVFGNDVGNYNTLVAFLEKKYTLISTILTSLLDLKKEIIFFSTELIEIQTSSLNSDSMFCAQDIMNDYEIKYDQCLNNIEPLATSDNQNIIQGDNNNNNNNNNNNDNNPQHKLDITQSTEKSLDDNENGSVSSISTEISALEKTRTLIIQNFVDSYIKHLKDKKFSLKENYEFIFKKLRLNFLNNNYYSLTLSLLSFLKTIIFSTNINLTQSQIQYLFILFVENSVDEEEMNLFFDFFAEVLKCQYLKKEKYISEDNICYIFFDLLIKLDLISLPYSGFNLFNQIFFLINTTHGNLITNGGKIIDVKKFNQLFGFETLWTFYLETKSQAISTDCLNLLVVLISTLGKHNDDNCKQNFNLIFDKIFTRLYSCTQSLQMNKNDLETQEKAKKLINLLFIINSTKQKIDSKGKELITVLIKNNYYSNEEKTEQLQVSTDLTIKELKMLIIDKVLSNEKLSVKKKMEENGILINWKGKLLKDKFFIKDYKMESGSALIIFKDDPSFKSNDIDPQILAQGVFQLKNIFDGFSDDLLRLCLKKCSGNVEEAIMYLTEESHIDTLAQELLEDNANPFNGDVSQIQSANLELFTDEKINLILQLLEIGIESVNSYIWTLLSAIKYPNGFIEPIIEMKFADILNTERKSRLLLFLQLINCLIFGDKFFVHLKTIDNRNQWINNLLNSEGLEILLKTIDELIKEFSKEKMFAEKINVSDYTKNIMLCLNILIKWLHYFTFTCSCAILNNSESLKSVQSLILKNRPTSLDIGIQIHSDSNNNSNFKDKNNAPSPSLKSNDSNNNENNKQFNPQSSSTIVINNETSHKFLFKFIEYNYHIIILDFFNSISDIKFTQIPSQNQEPEIILISLIEILIICNEINEIAFLYSLDFEIQYCVLINLLFTESSKSIRKVVENFFLIISQSKKVIELKRLNIKKATNQILANHIINNYKRIYSSSAYEEFFNLFGYILTHEKEFNCENLENFNFKDLTEHILTKIHKGSNQNELNESGQEQLTGYVHLLHCLSTNHEEIIIESIEKMTNELDPINFFYNCLFNINSIDNNNTDINGSDSDLISSYSNIQFKYSNKNLRQKCYNLLLSFMRIKTSFKIELYNKMIHHHTKLIPCSNVLCDFDIPFRGKHDTFIGLKNYGATCYLNSLLQQLFMMPSFIKNLYSFKISPKEEKDIEFNPIYQLQIAFANLRSTLRKYYPPISFVKSIKTAFNGEPIALGVQQDSDEFFTIMTDALEKQAKIYNNEHFLEESFKGKICNEIISLEPECPYYNSTDESSIRITLDIKNQRTLEEALDFFIKEEILEGENKYFVEKHNKKISISKRYLIKHLSNNVIIHLKRFEFDYNRFENSKLNDYISFPHEIDFRKWMRSSIVFNNKGDERYKDVTLDEEELRELNDVDSYKYVLTGILIHSGSTLQHGHYYSFIMDQESGKWYRFDDSTVREFNPENIEQECFGEDKENGISAYQKCQNAYLLFYTKRTDYDAIRNKIKDNEKNGSNGNNSIINNHKIPNEINEMIHNENVDFLKMKTYVDNDYYIFVKEFIEYVYSKTKSYNNINTDDNDNKEGDKDNENSNNANVIIEKYTKHTSMSKIQRKNMEIYQMICKMKDSSVSNINITESNINEIIAKCKCEINSKKEEERSNDNEIKSNKNNNGFPSPMRLQKNLIKFGLYYYFEIILNQNDKNKITSFANFISDKISCENYASTWFIKKIEKTPQIFFNHILLNTTQEIRASIQQLVYCCFISTYQNEIKWLNDKYPYLDQNNPTEQKQEYYSCIMRTFNNVFLSNFDMGRVNWQRHHQFFSLITETFNLIPETLRLTNTPSFSLYHILISFIMNNRPGFKTKFNTMGNSVIEFTCEPAIEMLATIILSSITPGIINLKNYSRWSKNIMKSQENYLYLPNQWDVILHKEVMGDVLLRLRATNTEKQIVHHLGHGDFNTSKAIIKAMMISFRDNFKDIFSIFNLIQNTKGLFDIEDSFKNNRVEAYFAFDSDIENEFDLSPIFEYLFSFRDELPFQTFFSLKNFAQLIIDYDHIKQYLIMHKHRIDWIYYFLKEFDTNETKKTAMQIECTAQNYDFNEMYLTNIEVYFNAIGIINRFQNEHYEKSKL